MCWTDLLAHDHVAHALDGGGPQQLVLLKHVVLDRAQPVLLHDAVPATRSEDVRMNTCTSI